MFPMSSELWAKKQYEKLSDGLRRLHKYVLIIIIPMIFALISFSNLFLKIFFGKEYVAGSLAMQIILIGTIFYALTYINNSVLLGIGKPKIIAKILLTAAFLNVILNFILIPKFGIEGAALATAISYITSLLISIKNISRIIKLKFPFLDMVKIILSGILFVFVIYYLKKIIVFNIFLESIITLTIAGIVYLVLIFLLKVITINEIKELVRTVFAR